MKRLSEVYGANCKLRCLHRGLDPETSHPG